MSQIIQAGRRQPLLLAATGDSMLGNASTTPIPGSEQTPSSKGSAIDLAAFGPDQPPGEGVGLVLGRFLPLHLGSQFLIEFATHYVAQLTVLIRGQDQDAIPSNLRIAWLRQLFPEVSVILVHDDRVPKKGDEDSSFFNRWNQKIRQQVPTGLDYLFASEKYGSRLAKMLGAALCSRRSRGRPCRLARRRSRQPSGALGLSAAVRAALLPAARLLTRPGSPRQDRAGRAAGKPFRDVLRRRLRGASCERCKTS